MADFVHLPVMQIGEWIIFENMGAYSISVVSKFDESPFHRLFAIINEEIRLVFFVKYLKYLLIFNHVKFF